MGEVYKARDTRLDRTVAIKVAGAAGSCAAWSAWCGARWRRTRSNGFKMLVT
jgi:hypothetical protein